MMQKERTWATIPPYFPNLLLGVFCLYLGISQLPGSFWELDVPELIFIGAGVFYLFGSCVHCTILPKGLLIQFLWIPFRFIRWEKVGGAELVTRWFHSQYHNGYRFRARNGGIRFDRRFIHKEGPAWFNGRGIFVKTRWCPGYLSEQESMLLFRLKHPVGAMFFRMTPIRQKLYLRLFLRYYPGLDLPLDVKQTLEESK